MHSAGGFIVNQFLDNTSNHRTDEWGGNKENRARFGLEVLKELIEVFGKNVGIKVNPTGGLNDVGYVSVSSILYRGLLLTGTLSMPLDENLNTYKYYFSELEKLGLAYIILVRYTPTLDAIFDGASLHFPNLFAAVTYVPSSHLGVGRATRHDVMASYRPVIKKTPLLLNGAVLPEEGAQLVASGQIDAINIGFNWITHPDLVKRIEHGKPLDNVLDIQHIYADEASKDWRTGYTDYPLAEY